MVDVTILIRTQRSCFTETLTTCRATSISYCQRIENQRSELVFSSRKTAIAEGQKMPDKKGSAEEWPADKKFTMVLECGSSNESDWRSTVGDETFFQTRSNNGSLLVLWPSTRR